MNETMVQHKLNRNGPVSVEVSRASTAMGCGREITRTWNELDLFSTTVVRNAREGVVERANDLAERLLKAQIGLAEALYRRPRRQE